MSPDAEGWELIETMPEGVAVETKIDDGNGERNHQVLIREGRLLWVQDRSMYVYYVPTHWRTKR